MTKIHVPIYRRILGGSDKWTPERGSRYRQNTAPLEPFHSKLDVEPGSSVLFFAGGHGDWAHRLAQTTRVHYSDVSRPMTAFARQRFHGQGIEMFSTADAVRQPASRNYDYLVSFEPIPMRGTVLLTALRAMAKARGMRLVYGSRWFALKESVKDMSRAITPYGATLEFKKVFIKTEPDVNRDRTRQRYQFMVLKINSNPEAKRRAELDLATINALQKSKEHSLSDLQHHLSKLGLRADTKELVESLKRIHLLSKAMGDERFVEERHII